MLPKPPVPSLDHSLDRYIEYAKVVAEGQKRDIQKTLDAVKEFRRLGVVYQQRLEQIAEGESNWINQFWHPEMYFRSRLPLPVYTSPAYVFPQQHFTSEDDWLGKPASVEDVQVRKNRNGRNEHILVMCKDQENSY
ncbi:hypothetical protein ANCCAN_17932 [Ancylostoma caninum]|uniref:Choline/carnitine acyltransferase domain-containing protein n=1 Tax=Ancylostoma caninum TaxID=29170 RepID=A0A368FXH7_ANCCA|nr:hypothetical protein ANCCAN_17932 [Ancylostoma caninum]